MNDGRRCLGCNAQSRGASVRKKKRRGQGVLSLGEQAAGLAPSAFPCQASMGLPVTSGVRFAGAWPSQAGRRQPKKGKEGRAGPRRPAGRGRRGATKSTLGPWEWHPLTRFTPAQGVTNRASRQGRARRGHRRSPSGGRRDARRSCTGNAVKNTSGAAASSKKKLSPSIPRTLAPLPSPRPAACRWHSAWCRPWREQFKSGVRADAQGSLSRPRAEM